MRRRTRRHQYLHYTKGLGLLHLAEDQSQHQVQVLAELVPDLGDHYGDQSPHEGGCVLRGFRVQEFGYHLHDVIQPIVTWGRKKHFLYYLPSFIIQYEDSLYLLNMQKLFFFKCLEF